MRPFKKLIPLEEALEIGCKAVEPVTEHEVIEVREANGRVVATDIHAEVDVPPFDRAAMDGFAVRAEDTYTAGGMHPITLDIKGSIYAGEERGYRIGNNECVSIATGALLPAGADAVVMVENTERDGEVVRVMKPVHPRENVSKRGEDVTKGTVILREGDRLNPARVGVLSAVGLAKVTVFVKPRIAVIPTGGEITEPGQKLGVGQVYNVNSYTLAPLIEDNGGIPVVMPVAEDILEALECALEATVDCRMIIFTGGSSVGERDFILDLLDKRGEVLFHGIMVKPGKPTILGRTEKALVMGMPGYPTSCLSNGYLILEPILRKMARLPSRRRETLALRVDRRVVSTIGRHQFFPVKVRRDIAVPTFKESGAITSMSEADGYIEIPANVDLIERGETVRVTLI